MTGIRVVIYNSIFQEREMGLFLRNSEIASFCLMVRFALSSKPQFSLLCPFFHIDQSPIQEIARRTMRSHNPNTSGGTMLSQIDVNTTGSRQQNSKILHLLFGNTWLWPPGSFYLFPIWSLSITKNSNCLLFLQYPFFLFARTLFLFSC